MKNQLRFLFIVIFLSSFSSVFSQDTTKAAYKLRVGDLNVGLDSRYLNTCDSPTASSYNTYASGVSLRYQSSIILNYYDKKNPKRKFKAGDLLSSEVSVGYMNSNDPVQKLPVWFAYRFELGAAFLYRCSKDVDIGLNLIMLRFARDFVTENISGSGVDARLRIKRVVVEGGLDSRELRILGIITPFFNNQQEQNMNHLGFRYLLNPTHNIGLRFEWIDKNNTQNGDGLHNLRVYWGRYF